MFLQNLRHDGTAALMTSTGKNAAYLDHMGLARVSGRILRRRPLLFCVLLVRDEDICAELTTQLRARAVAQA